MSKLHDTALKLYLDEQQRIAHEQAIEREETRRRWLETAADRLEQVLGIKPASVGFKREEGFIQLATEEGDLFTYDVYKYALYLEVFCPRCDELTYLWTSHEGIDGKIDSLNKLGYLLNSFIEWPHQCHLAPHRWVGQEKGQECCGAYLIDEDGDRIRE